ncbi:phosphoribosyltransferase family protein [uncultured Sphingomonas sp.]|uniref:phosphoribosyltransferase family protein n=1 Tax=uncultured Sphingomonas sp. TaxID=158754 RepID=UPI0035CB73DE
MLSCDWSSRLADFAGDVVVRLAKHSRAGERLLLVDDINDSGLTIGALRTALAKAGAISGSVRIATLIDNRVSAQRVDYRARVIDRTVTKDWYVFPWEAVGPDTALQKDAAAVAKRIG